MHPEALDFLDRMKKAYPEAFKGKVLECGSLDINGSPRKFFEASEYIGIDWRPGPGVDVVMLIHNYTEKPDGHFDTVISTETLEHDSFWQMSLERMISLLRPGGFLVLTCAGPGREEHYIETSPERGGYYKNVPCSSLVRVLISYIDFSLIHAEYDDKAKDTRFFGRKE